MPVATATVASVPRAVALLEFRTPAVTLRVVPFTKLVAGAVKVVSAGPGQGDGLGCTAVVEAAKNQRRVGRRAEGGIAGERRGTQGQTGRGAGRGDRERLAADGQRAQGSRAISTSMVALLVTTTLFG